MVSWLCQPTGTAEALELEKEEASAKMAHSHYPFEQIKVASRMWIQEEPPEQLSSLTSAPVAKLCSSLFKVES